MKHAEITDPIFRAAVEAIDSGHLTGLQLLLQVHARLVTERLPFPETGYFKHPYLIWFVAGNPVRQEQLPDNIADIMRLLVQYVKEKATASWQKQIDYCLGLVATGRIAHECGVQIELMDILINAGAFLGNTHGALANGNTAAAQHLLQTGSRLTLAAAVCLDREKDIPVLLETAGSEDRAVALVAAAFYGKKAMLPILLAAGADVSAYPAKESGFHSHATALHQAVFSGSLATVQLLVEAGARLSATDLIYKGTAVEWALHLQADEKDAAKKEQYIAIENFLRAVGA